MRRTVLLFALAFSTGEVRAQLTVSGSPTAMIVSGAVAGSAPSAVTNANTSYSISSPGTGKHANHGGTSPVPPEMPDRNVTLSGSNIPFGNAETAVLRVRRRGSAGHDPSKSASRSSLIYQRQYWVAGFFAVFIDRDLRVMVMVTLAKRLY